MLKIADRDRFRRRLLAVVAAVLAINLFVTPSARADVDAVSGSAFGLSASLLTLQLVPPTPSNPAGNPLGVQGAANEPQNGYGPVTGSALPINIPTILSVGILNASTQGGNLAGEDHFGFATSTASAANVVLGNPLNPALTATAISSTCTSNGDGSTGSIQLVNAFLGGTPLVESPAANTVIQVPGFISVVLNEQIVTNSPGQTSIIVRAVRAQVPVPGGQVADIIIAESRCAAAGPNVNSTTTSSSTTSSSTTSSSTTSSTTSTSTTSSTTTSTTSSTTTSTTTTTTIDDDIDVRTLCPNPPAPGVAPPGYNPIVGTDNNERIIGTPGNDIIWGLGGNDDLLGMGGNDIIIGGDGNDRLTGGNGSFTAPSGNDILCGGAGNDQLLGEDGHDGLSGDDGYDDLQGGDGNDTLLGGPGNDRLLGGPGVNTIESGPGTDLCVDPPPGGAIC